MRHTVNVNDILLYACHCHLSPLAIAAHVTLAGIGKIVPPKNHSRTKHFTRSKTSPELHSKLHRKYGFATTFIAALCRPYEAS